MLFGYFIGVFMPFVQSLGRQSDHISEIIKNGSSGNGFKGGVSDFTVLIFVPKLHLDLCCGIGQKKGV